MNTTREKVATTRPAAVRQAASHSIARRETVSAIRPNRVQTSLPISNPHDAAEQEADSTAKKIMRMTVSESPISYVQPDSGAAFRQVKKEEPEKKLLARWQSPYVAHAAAFEAIRQSKEKEEKRIQRKTDGHRDAGAIISADVRNSAGSGSPLPFSVRRFMEPRFQADFSRVKIHTGDHAARLNSRLNARAFAVGENIYFGKDRYQPESGEGRELIAHELTHTIQQGASIQRSPLVTATVSQPQIQRSATGKILDWIADKANNIPGFRMFTVILGMNPINLSAVDRSAANILRAVIEFMPGGALITQALDNHGVFAKVGAWIEGKIKALGMVGQMFKKALTTFLDSLGLSVLAPWNWGGVWDRAKRIFTEPVDRLISFAKGVVTDILKFVKDAILKPLAAMAQGTRGYDLLKAILGSDPITGEPVPRTADTLIGGFMKLIGQQDVWENIKKGKAIARAWAWFQGALAGLMGFVRSIPRRILDTFSSLTFKDIITVAGAFGKIVGAFVNIAGDFIKWGLNQVLSLLEILFSVVAPGVMPYLKKAQTAFVTILKNPIGFVGNLVKAGRMGFESFAAKFVEYLKAALIKWIVGPLADAGVYIPKSFSLLEIVKLVLSVLGLTWQNMRAKLVKIIPDPVLTALEKTAGILVTLVRDGPAAAWEQIKAELNELKDQLIAQITQMISIEVVKAAVIKLVSMLNPVGAVIQAIIAIYNTITFFIEKINQIAAVVASFIDSISAIAAGQIANASKKVEQTMANTLTVVIAFLAKFAGLGGIPNKIVGIIKKIRQPIDKGLDKIVAWVGNLLKKIGGAVKTGVKKILNWWKKKVSVAGGGEKHTLTFEGSEKSAKLVLRSTPEKPSIFLGNAAKKWCIETAKTKQPIAKSIAHEDKIYGFQNQMIDYERNAEAAAGIKNKDADDLMGKLDSEMGALGGHIVLTLDNWGIADNEIKGVTLPRGKFTLEQKRGIAAQHKDKSQLRESSTGELVNLQKGLARRHVVSSHDMAKHYEDRLNKKKISEGKLLLEQRASIPEARTPVEELSQKGIQNAARKRYSYFFGYLRNMFIGDSAENSSIQEYIDRGHPEMAGQKLQEHVSHIKRAWAFDQSMEISGLDQN